MKNTSPQMSTDESLDRRPLGKNRYRDSFPDGPFGKADQDAVAENSLRDAVAYHLAKGITPDRLIEIFTNAVRSQS